MQDPLLYLIVDIMSQSLHLLIMLVMVLLIMALIMLCTRNIIRCMVMDTMLPPLFNITWLVIMLHQFTILPLFTQLIIKHLSIMLIILPQCIMKFIIHTSQQQFP